MHLNTTWSIIYAHNGLFAIEARYFFSHIIYIASTLASISGRSSSPLLLGSVVSFQFISGFLPSHIKDFIWLVILWTTSLGISFAVARYIALVSQLCYGPVVTYCMVYHSTKRATLARLLANKGPAIYAVH